MAINPYYKRKMRTQMLRFDELEGLAYNKGNVRINLTDGAAFLYDDAQDFTQYALHESAKGQRRYKVYINEGTDFIAAWLDVEGAGETLGAELAVNGTFASDANWDKGDAEWTVHTLVAGKAAKTPVVPGSGTQTALAATANIAGTKGQLYKMTVDLVVTTGMVQVAAGSLILGQETVSGAKTYYWTNPATNFKPTFTANADFAGTIDNCVVKAVTAGAANVSVKLFDAETVGSQNIHGALASVPADFDCSGGNIGGGALDSRGYKIVACF